MKYADRVITHMGPLLSYATILSSDIDPSSLMLRQDVSSELFFRLNLSTEILCTMTYLSCAYPTTEHKSQTTHVLPGRPVDSDKRCTLPLILRHSSTIFSYLSFIDFNQTLRRSVIASKYGANMAILLTRTDPCFY